MLNLETASVASYTGGNSNVKVGISSILSNEASSVEDNLIDYDSGINGEADDILKDLEEQVEIINEIYG